MVRLQRCCCCSLRTGAFVIGYLNITNAVLSLVSTLAQLAAPTDKDEFALTITLVLSCVSLLVNSLMVYGVHEGKPGFLVAWMVVNFLVLVILTIVLTLLSIRELWSGADHDEYVVIFVVVPLAFALSWYLFFVVYSHYEQLCEGIRNSSLQNKYYSDDQIVIESE